MNLHRPRFRTASSSPASGFPPRPLAGSPEDPAPVRDLPAFLTEAGFPPPASVAPYGWTSPWLAKVAERDAIADYAFLLRDLEADRLTADPHNVPVYDACIDIVERARLGEIVDPEPVS